MINLIGDLPIDSSIPIILSASLTDGISGVVTTSASSAPAAAFLNPPSMPAGQSSRMKSKSGFNSSHNATICSGLTASFVLVCAAGRR